MHRPGSRPALVAGACLAALFAGAAGPAAFAQETIGSTSGPLASWPADMRLEIALRLAAAGYGAEGPDLADAAVRAFEREIVRNEDGRLDEADLGVLRGLTRPVLDAWGLVPVEIEPGARLHLPLGLDLERRDEDWGARFATADGSLVILAALRRGDLAAIEAADRERFGAALTGATGGDGWFGLEGRSEGRTYVERFAAIPGGALGFTVSYDPDGPVAGARLADAMAVMLLAEARGDRIDDPVEEGPAALAAAGDPPPPTGGPADSDPAAGGIPPGAVVIGRLVPPGEPFPDQPGIPPDGARVIGRLIPPGELMPPSGPTQSQPPPADPGDTGSTLSADAGDGPVVDLGDAPPPAERALADTLPAEPEVAEEPAEPVEPEVAEPPAEPVEPEVAEPPAEPVEPEVAEPPAEPVEPEVAETPAEPVEPEVAEPPAEPIESEVAEPPAEPVEPEVAEAPAEPPGVDIAEPAEPPAQTAEADPLRPAPAQVFPTGPDPSIADAPAEPPPAEQASEEAPAVSSAAGVSAAAPPSSAPPDAAETPADPAADGASEVGADVAALPPGTPAGGAGGQAGSTAGVFVAGGLVLTNAEPLSGCREVTLSGAFTGEGQVTARDPERDLALVRVGGVAPGIARLNFAAPDRGTVRLYRPGEEGQARAVEGSIALEGVGRDWRFLSVTLPDSEGVGGPLLDHAGNLVAMVPTSGPAPGTASVEPVEDGRLALKASLVASFLDANNVRFMLGSGISALPASEVEAAARTFSVVARCAGGTDAG